MQCCWPVSRVAGFRFWRWRLSLPGYTPTCFSRPIRSSKGITSPYPTNYHLTKVGYLAETEAKRREPTREGGLSGVLVWPSHFWGHRLGEGTNRKSTTQTTSATRSTLVLGVRHSEPLGVLHCDQLVVCHRFRGVNGRSCPQVLCFFLFLLPVWQLQPIASRITLSPVMGA